MTYTKQNFDALIGIDGCSKEALTLHFGLYEGYVNNVNALREKIAAAELCSPERAELMRRFAWEFNGMRLHEYYFGALSQKPQALAEDADLMQKMVRDFGSFEAWQGDFVSIAKHRGIGWTILVYDEVSDQLFNLWVNEHDLGHLAGAKIILPIDLLEHAFLPDYGTDRASYIAAFLAAVDWSVVAERL